MTLLKDNDYKEINIALLSLEADIKKLNNNSSITSQLADINKRIDEINKDSGGSTDEIEAEVKNLKNDVIAINSDIEDIDTQINGIEQKLSDIFSAKNRTTDFNTTTNSGIYYWATDAANKPGTDYGVLLVNKYDGGNDLWINQIAYGTNNKIYFRQNINSGNWTEWKAVAFDGETTAKKVANALTVNGKTYDGSSAVNAGVQTVANGGTGAITAKGAQKSLLSDMQTETTEMDDTTEFVMKYGTPTDTKGALFKRSATLVWNYIKGKISSVLGLTKDNYGGKAATAGTADTVDNYHASQLWRSDGATWNPKANVSLGAKANGDEWSFDISRNGHTGCYWQVWDENKKTLLKVDADSGKVSAPYGFVGNVTGNKLTIQGDTVGSNSYTDTNPKLVFNNPDGSQGISLTFNDYDKVQAPASLTLNGNQGNEYFIAPCIKVNNKLRIPIGAPSQLEDGCIWIG